MNDYDGIREEFVSYSDEAAEAACGMFFGLIALAWNLFVEIPRALLRRN